MKLKYIYGILGGILISTVSASAFDDASSIEEESCNSEGDSCYIPRSRIDVLAADFERSYDAAQARKDRKRSKEALRKEEERRAHEDAMKALAEKIKAESSPKSPLVKVASPKIVKSPKR